MYPHLVLPERRVGRIGPTVPVAFECGGGGTAHSPAAGFSSVSIGPGCTLLTVMPRPATSLDLKEAKISRFRGGGARVSDARTLPASATAVRASSPTTTRRPFFFRSCLLSELRAIHCWGVRSPRCQKEANLGFATRSFHVGILAFRLTGQSMC
jgi:hypothetical protein